MKFWITGEVTGRAWVTDDIEVVTRTDHITGEESISDDYWEIEGSPRDILAIAATTCRQPGSEWAISASREIFEHLVDCGALKTTIELTPEQMERLDDGQGWWAPGDRVFLHCAGGHHRLGLEVEFRATDRPADDRRMDREQIEKGEEDGYEWESWVDVYDSDYEWLLDLLVKA
jgi:hypothetical protein